MFNLMEFFNDIFAKQDKSLVGLYRLNEVKEPVKKVARKPEKKEYKLSELMKKTAVD